MAEFGTKSHSRNPLIFGLFVRIHMVEQLGSGIGRIKDQMKVANLPVPIFKTDGMFTAVLHRTVEKTVEETVEIILKAMRENPKITAKDLEVLTGLTRRGVEYHIDKLKKAKIIKRVGSTKGGSWELIIHPS
jgi:ATP-dependent DNA helicase RecG